MGINVGDIIIDGGSIHGDGVNVAARLEALAEPGGICVSGRVQEDVHGRLDIERSQLWIAGVAVCLSVSGSMIPKATRRTCT
jgi:class 3 adenylate cyclase